MRITEAAQHLGTSPRMLRYRDSLGLLPAVRDRSPRAGRRPCARPRSVSPVPHRQFEAGDLDAVALALAIEHRYDVTPAALAFGIRVLADPAVRADVAELGRRIGRIPAPAVRALDFEKERALRLLELPNARPPSRRSTPPGPPSRRSTPPATQPPTHPARPGRLS